MRILLAPRTLAATLSVAAALISPQCLPHCARSRPVAGAGVRAPARRVPSLRSPPAKRAAAAARRPRPRAGASLALVPERGLADVAYEDTGKRVGEICAGRPLKAPGEKVAKGLLPKCVLVTATATSKAKQSVKDAAVYGYVRTATGDSAIANNPDFRSDAGQFAMIKTVPPGSERVQFEFVAVIPDKDIGAVEGSLGKLTFYPLGHLLPGRRPHGHLHGLRTPTVLDECDGEQAPTKCHRKCPSSSVCK